ncbi:MAG: chemotaxis protein CheX [Magnetococcales bacterium]|nr:chemotaxis protein CheX [Magnetococcales bacterium]
MDLHQHILEATEESVMEIVNTMLFLNVAPSAGVAKPTGVVHVAARAEVSAMVGLNGGLNGGVRVACSGPVARILAGALSGEHYKGLTEEAKDGFAEIGNMISGGIQTRLMNTTNVGEVNLTPPTIIVGGDYEVDYKSQLESVRQFFRVNDQPFYVEVHYQVEAKPQVNISLDPDVVAQVDAWIGQLGSDRAEVLANLVRRAAGR